MQLGHHILKKSTWLYYKQFYLAHNPITKSLWITPSMATQVLNHYALLLKEFLKEVFITCSYNLVLISNQNLS